jgi:hypothetical protein
MKRIISGIISLLLVLSLALAACGETVPTPGGNNEPAPTDNITDPQNGGNTNTPTDNNGDTTSHTVDLGCCVTNVTVRETAMLGENTVTHTSNFCYEKTAVA